jgi:site-specific recombinase XerD
LQYFCNILEAFMASITYNHHLKQWHIRWHITCPSTKKIESGSKLLPKGSTRCDADSYATNIVNREKLIKLGQTNTADSITEAYQKFQLHIARHTARTQQHYIACLNAFVASLANDITSTRHLNASNIQDHVNHLLATGISNRTVNARLTAVKSFCKFISNYYGCPNPAADVKMLPEDPPIQRFLSEAEYASILLVASPCFRDRVIFIANTGLRISEFCNLRWCDINGDSLTITGKGRKRRIVPLNAAALDVLKRQKTYPNILDAIFISKSTRPDDAGKTIRLTRHAVSLQCAKYAKRANIPCFGPHALRHYFATQLLVKGVHIALVARLLGHSSIKTTEQIYIHILPKHLAGLTDCLLNF